MTPRSLAFLPLAVLCLAAAAPESQPSRPADKNSRWERFEDRSLGLGAWVERCGYGDRKIDFLRQKNALVQRYSGGSETEPVVEVFDLEPGEKPVDGVSRVFRAHTDAKLAARCRVAPYTDAPSPAGVERFTVLPSQAFQKELDVKPDKDEVPTRPAATGATLPTASSTSRPNPRAR